ncbi:hypothetical protein CDAR_220571 [Caerostris darwini]|uniref:Uncharacterized protein n=1 Tax=Caerostris darwini TaxID=1538125 RepID=A0AAV4M5T5_9ARAC|nr:hypothetical protein CDAR_370391 [Caerostris darwini]GIY56574.1 hypothetical protein CDAR_220571 [Caerostris darwini]
MLDTSLTETPIQTFFRDEPSHSSYDLQCEHVVSVTFAAKGKQHLIVNQERVFIDRKFFQEGKKTSHPHSRAPLAILHLNRAIDLDCSTKTWPRLP